MDDRRRFGFGKDTRKSDISMDFKDDIQLETFVWGKKLEKEGLHRYDQQTRDDMSRKRKRELESELARVKKRRTEREIEKRMRDEEFNNTKYSKNDCDYNTWKHQEVEFDLNQARLRSKLRILHNRAKPIDILAADVSSTDINELHLNEPTDLIDNLSIQDCMDLKEDIAVYRNIEKDTNSEFWNDVEVVLDFHHQKLIKESNANTADGQGEVGRHAIHSVARDDISRILQNKTVKELQAISVQIETKLKEKNEFVDVAFWEHLKQELQIYLAKSRLKERHDRVIQQTSKKDDHNTSEINKSLQNSAQDSSKDNQQNEEAISHILSNSFMKPIPSDTTEDEVKINLSIEAYHKGCYSPPRISFSQIEKNHWRDSSEDLAHLSALRESLKNGFSNLPDGSEKMYEIEKSKKMDENEEEFDLTVPLPKQEHKWYQKYRPRKPKYFNKVHTGYEWNKYNQTHYDSDNPPPKIVQGYKFNIFYPELVDKSITPEYSITPCDENKEFSILRFTAGPPYEDIAFKIVNHEWDLANRQGFRSQFSNNVFQLWFHFKRHRYRR